MILETCLSHQKKKLQHYQIVAEKDKVTYIYHAKRDRRKYYNILTKNIDS